jgi:hypothetical protein
MTASGNRKKTKLSSGAGRSGFPRRSVIDSRFEILRRSKSCDPPTRRAPSEYSLGWSKPDRAFPLNSNFKDFKESSAQTFDLECHMSQPTYRISHVRFPTDPNVNLATVDHESDYREAHFDRRPYSPQKQPESERSENRNKENRDNFLYQLPQREATEDASRSREGCRLKDLCEDDKAKVAKLIKQVSSLLSYLSVCVQLIPAYGFTGMSLELSFYCFHYCACLHMCVRVQVCFAVLDYTNRWVTRMRRRVTNTWTIVFLSLYTTGGAARSRARKVPGGVRAHGSLMRGMLTSIICPLPLVHYGVVFVHAQRMAPGCSN